MSEVIEYSKSAEPNIEVICSKEHALSGVASRFLEEGLRSIGDNSIDLKSYEQKTYGAEVSLELAKTEDCEVKMGVILLDDGQIGNPQIVIDSPEYTEEIYDGSIGDIVIIKGKKISFALNAEGQFLRVVSFGSSTSYEPYSAVISDCWGEPSVPAVSHEGFLVEREISNEEKELLMEYLESPSDIKTLALATKCTDEDRRIREQKRQQVLECVASRRRYEDRIKDAAKAQAGVRPSQAAKASRLRSGGIAAALRAKRSAVNNKNAVQ